MTLRDCIVLKPLLSALSFDGCLSPQVRPQDLQTANQPFVFNFIRYTIYALLEHGQSNRSCHYHDVIF